MLSPWQGQSRRKTLPACLEFKLRAGKSVVFNMDSAIVGLFRESKGHVSGASRLLDPLIAPRLVGIDYGEAFTPQALKNLSLGPSNVIDAVKMSEMCC